MLKNNKGFTVIELIMSFVFSSILAISLFSVIVTYKGKQVDSTIEAELLAFKSHIVMDVQEDIQLKGLKEIDTCKKVDPNTGLEIPNVIEPRCVNITFNDNSKKVLRIKSDSKVDKIMDENGVEIAQYDYYIPYVLYGDIKYSIPDGASIYIDDDYILHTRSINDGIETRTKLYKISFKLNHSDLDADVDISIVANGTKADPVPAGNYKSYSIGEKVSIQVNDQYQRQFRVIQTSSKTNDSVVLLYNDVYDDSLVLKSTQFNLLQNYANRYNISMMKDKIRSIEIAWSNADVVRLITTEEISRIANFCPQYRGVDSADISLAYANTENDWLFGEGTNKRSYWTMSEKLVSGNDNGKKVWFVDSDHKALSSAYVNANYAIRPVIVVKKIYIAEIKN